MKRTREISRSTPQGWKEHLVKASQKLQELAEVHGVLRTIRSLTALVIIVACCPIFMSLKLGKTAWRRLLRKILHFKHPAAVPHEERTNDTSISLVLCKRFKNTQELHRKLAEVVANQAELQQKCCRSNILGQYWVPTRINLEDNIVQLLPTWKHQLVTEENIEEYASELCSQQLPADLPPWKVWLIPLRYDEFESYQFWIVIKAQNALHNLLYHAVTGESEGFHNNEVSSRRDSRQGGRTLQKVASSIQSRLAAWMMDLVLPKVVSVLYMYCEDFLTRTALKDRWKLVGQFMDCVLYWYYAVRKLSLQELLSEIKRTLSRGLLTLLICVTNLGLVWFRLPITLYHLVVYLFTMLNWYRELVMAVPSAIKKWAQDLWASDDPDLQLVKQKAILVREALEVVWYGPRLTLDAILRNCNLDRRSSVAVRDEQMMNLSWSNAIPLGLLDRICASSNTKLLDVLLTACSKAVRELYKAQGKMCEPVPVKVPYSWCNRTPFSSDLELLAEENQDAFEGHVAVVLPCDVDDLLWTLKKVKLQTKAVPRMETMLRVERQCERFIQSLPMSSYILPTMKTPTEAKLSVTKSPSLTATSWDTHYALHWPSAGKKFQFCASFSSTGLRLGILSNVTRSQLSMVTSCFERQVYELAALFGVQNRRLSPHSSPSASPKQTPPPTPRSASRVRFVFPEML